MPLYSKKDIIDDEKREADGEQVGESCPYHPGGVRPMERMSYQTQDMKATAGHHSGVEPDRPLLGGVHAGEKHQSDQSGVPFRTVGKGRSQPVEGVSRVVRAACRDSVFSAKEAHHAP